MKSNPYVNYLSKSASISKKLETEKIDEVILDNLKEKEINIENINVKYIVELIKKIIFNYYMYGMLNTNMMIKENTGDLIASLTNRDPNSINELKQLLNDSLRNLNFNFNTVDNPEFERFLIGSASKIKSDLDRKVIDSQMYIYQIR